MFYRITLAAVILLGTLCLTDAFRCYQCDRCEKGFYCNETSPTCSPVECPRDRTCLSLEWEGVKTKGCYKKEKENCDKAFRKLVPFVVGKYSYVCWKCNLDLCNSALTNCAPCGLTLLVGFIYYLK